jgi:hypothetical protein
MLKKLVAFAFAAGFSLSASAGYVRYNVNSDGVSGFFVQNTDTRAIAYFSLKSYAPYGNQYMASGIFSNIVSAHSNFYHDGPTSFQAYSYLNDAYYSVLNLSFAWNDNADGIEVSGWESGSPMPGIPFAQAGFRYFEGGTVNEVPIDPGLLAALENGQTDGINNIIPTPMPEPASIALVAAGGALLAGLRRRAKRASASA